MAEPADTTGPVWIADPAIAWRIVLTADLGAPLLLDDARPRLAALHADQGWPGEGTVRVADDLEDLRRDLGDEREGVVSLGLTPDGRRVVVSAHHSRVDGLGLLAVLSAVTLSTITSSARGVGERPDGSGPLGTVVRRLVEVGATPPARITTSPPTTPDPRDVYVERDVSGVVRTGHLVLAGGRGVAAFERDHGGARRPPRHVAVAVGVTRDATPSPIADRSALLRLRDVERLDLAAVTELLRHAPTQRAAQGAGGGAGVMRVGLRLLAPRLGSTLLVSHLGEVSAPEVGSLAFHPVTAGGTGVSLGAVGIGGTTRLTVRARGSDWTHDGLERLLEAVVGELDQVRR